jgi:TonB family protein
MRRPCLLAIAICAAAAVARADPAAPAEPPLLEAVFLKDYSSFEGGYGATGPYFPAAAAAGELNGEAVLRCTLTAKGRLKSCALVSDDPSGLYFGAAAMAMARDGVITAKPPAPLTADAVVRVHVAFVLDR